MKHLLGPNLDADHPLYADLAGLWAFDEGVGLRVRDKISGNIGMLERESVDVNYPRWMRTPLGWGVELIGGSGDNDHRINLGDHVARKFTGAFSLLWYGYLADAGNIFTGLVSKMGDATHRSCAMGCNGTLLYALAASDINNLVAAYASVTLADVRTYPLPDLIVATFAPGGSGGIQLYVNGAAVGTPVAGGDMPNSFFNGNGFPWCVQSRGDGGYTTDGTVLLTAMFSKALSAGEVLDLYHHPWSLLESRARAKVVTYHTLLGSDGTPVTGDAAYHVLRRMCDGPPLLPLHNAPLEIADGLYAVPIDAGENYGHTMQVVGWSTTTGVILEQVAWTNLHEADVSYWDGRAVPAPLQSGRPLIHLDSASENKHEALRLITSTGCYKPYDWNNVILSGPAAVYCNQFRTCCYLPAVDKTAIGILLPTYRAGVILFDHQTQQFSAMVSLGGSGVDDDAHGQPSLCLDADGTLYCFYGSHSSPQYYRTAVAPYTSWSSESQFGSAVSYPQPWLNPDGKLYVFFRDATTTPQSYAYVTDADGFTSKTKVLQATISGQIPYGMVRQDSTGKFQMIFCMFTGPGVLDRQGLYYFQLTPATGVVKKANGTTITTLGGGNCVTEATADEIVAGSATIVNAMGDVALTSDDQPLWVGMQETSVQFRKWTGSAWIGATVATGDDPYNVVALTVHDDLTYSCAVRLGPVGGSGPLDEYVSKDGGASWQYNRRLLSDGCGQIARNYDSALGNPQVRMVISGGPDGPNSVYAVVDDKGPPNPGMILAGKLGEILQQTSSLVPAVAPVFSGPMTAGKIIKVARGYSYKAEDNRALQMSGKAADWPVLTGGSCALKVKNQQPPYAVRTTVSGTVMAARNVSFDLTISDVTGLPIGWYNYEVSAVPESGNLVLLSKGILRVEA